MKEDRKTEKTWNTALYDGKNAFVWKYGRGVVELLAPKPGERILDLGCGTGHLTNQIGAAGAEVIGLDKSQPMIEEARRLYPDLRFEIADATDFHLAQPFDAVFSNAAIHWMKDQTAVARCIWEALRQGGRFVAEFGGKGTPHFGLIAEEVDKACPDLVGRDAKGEIDTVRYEAVNVMLLNEFLKEHKRVQQQAGKIEEQARKLEEQQATIAQLTSTDAKQQAIITQLTSTDTRQQQEIQSLTASLKEQGAQIQKVSDQVELNKPAPHLVDNNQ